MARKFPQIMYRSFFALNISFQSDFATLSPSNVLVVFSRVSSTEKLYNINMLYNLSEWHNIFINLVHINGLVSNIRNPEFHDMKMIK